MARITINVNDNVQARVEAKISTTIEEWLINKLRAVAVYDDLTRFVVGRTDAEEEQQRIEEMEAVDTEKQRLITELEA